MLPKSFLGKRRNDKAARANSPEPLSPDDVDSINARRALSAA
jgi:hypothetical protein